MELPSVADYWGEISPSILIIVGFVMFVFPEPATSALGSGLMLLGISWWFYEWNPRSESVEKA